MADVPQSISELDDDIANDGVPVRETYFPAATPDDSSPTGYSTKHYKGSGLSAFFRTKKVKYTAASPISTFTDTVLINKTIIAIFLDGYYVDDEDVIDNFNNSTGKVDFISPLPANTKITILCAE